MLILFFMKLKTNHCAVYVGNGDVIHHPLGKFSEKTPYRGWLRELTTHVIRHKDMPEFKFEETVIDGMTIINQDKRRILERYVGSAQRKN